jgi:uncharacterized delta-60 repeat protein
VRRHVSLSNTKLQLDPNSAYEKEAAAQFVRRLAREDSLLAKTFGVRSSFGEGGSLITALYALLVALLVCLPSTSRAQLVDSFDPNANNDVRVLAVQADGKILVGGFFTSIGGQTRNRIARLNPDGSLDTSFDPNANSDVRPIALQADGKILVVGLFSSIGGQTRNGIARLNSDGSLDASFDPNANDFVFAVAVQADGKILVGGAFQFIGGQPRNRIARLNPEAPGCSVTSTVCGRIIVGTAPTDFTVNLSDPADPATVQATDFMVNGTPADNDIIINGDLSITFHFNTSPVVGGQNTMHIPAGAFNCGQGSVQEFTCTLFYRVPGATPPPRPRPTPHPRPTPP